MIFIDSDAFVALNHGGDALHSKATTILSRLTSTETPLITSWDVIDETATKLSYKIDRKLAIEFLTTTLSSTISIYQIPLDLYPKIRDTFASQTSKNVSLTDCANIVLAKSVGVNTFFSFDHHYIQNGFQLLA